MIKLKLFWQTYLSGFVIWLASVILGIIVMPIGLTYGFFKIFWHTHIGNALAALNTKFRILGGAFDVYANSAICEIFNDTMLKKTTTHTFGNEGEYLSDVFAANYLTNTLTDFGCFIAKRLIAFKDTSFK